ncbi:MAG: hypothetical protein DMG06_21405 [Acidobacteria bacterium]|nr:MAG: hypothetical protein DMG06_21405 [Acidobacteriota bacterium]
MVICPGNIGQRVRGAAAASPQCEALESRFSGHPLNHLPTAAQYLLSSSSQGGIVAAARNVQTPWLEFGLTPLEIGLRVWTF